MNWKLNKVSETKFKAMIRNNFKIELLAPAKDKSTAIAAINAGADAIYIGYLKFGARKQAGNSLDDIKEIVEYANVYRAKIYVTLNTIYNNKEISEVVKTIYDIYNIGVSGIIVQDMGLLEHKLPPIKIFASTQCHNDSLEKIKFLEKTGFDRVILPREFSLEQIKNITDNTKIEIETFIHGALCVSYSGQCYLSYAIGGRSANRGECAQPCRKKYSLFSNDGKIIEKNRYLLSLMDLNLSNKIEDLINAGVTSFKIEGRLKDENYVQNVVSYYRKKIDEILKKYNLQKSSVGVSYPNFEPIPEKSFNRGFTEFFINGERKNFCTKYYSKSIGEFIGKITKISKNNFTITGQKLNNGDGICFLNDKNELIGTQIQKVENDKIFPKSMTDLKVGIKIFRNSDINFDKIVLRKKIERKIPIDASVKITNKEIELTLTDEEKIYATVKINDNFELAQNAEKSINTIKNQITKTGNTEFYINNIYIEQSKNYFVRASILNELRRIAIENLRITRKEKYQKDIRTKKISMAEYPLKNLDYRANIYNDFAKEFYEKRGAVVSEFAAESQKNLDGKVLMTTKHCIKYTLGLCKKHYKNVKNYKEPLILTDEFNKKYILEFDCKNCIMTLKTSHDAC